VGRAAVCMDDSRGMAGCMDHLSDCEWVVLNALGRLAILAGVAHRIGRDVVCAQAPPDETISPPRQQEQHTTGPLDPRGSTSEPIPEILSP